MKLFFLIAFLVAAGSLRAQKQGPFPAADSITLSGLVATPATLPLSMLGTFPDTTFIGLKINNHLGEYKFTYGKAKAVLFKTFLQKNLSTTLKSKELLGVYFVCKAVDGFTVVYSYNELFNAATGSIYILTAYDDVSLGSMPERPILLITSDYKSGRLFMRGLASIEVRLAK